MPETRNVLLNGNPVCRRSSAAAVAQRMTNRSCAQEIRGGSGAAVSYRPMRLFWIGLALGGAGLAACDDAGLDGGGDGSGGAAASTGGAASDPVARRRRRGPEIERNEKVELSRGGSPRRAPRRRAHPPPRKAFRLRDRAARRCLPFAPLAGLAGRGRAPRG